jgi:hypothetical protein
VRMTSLITTKTKATITNMNKDQKLLAEAYDNIQFTQRKKPFLEKSDRLNPTAKLEDIADFFNKHKVWSGAPTGSWHVHNNEVVNDDAEEGRSGISVRIVPEKRGLRMLEKQPSGSDIATLFYWPVQAKDLEASMQRKTTNL